MQKKWTDKNVDLVLLATHIGNFFKEKDFEAIKGEIPNGYQIFAENSPYFRLDGYVSVTIEGKSDDFTIKLELCREGKRSLTPLLLTTMFVGGYFLSKKLRSDEDWMRLEKEFWRHLDNFLLHLSDSPRDFSCSST
jgi:hypothetical protein